MSNRVHPLIALKDNPFVLAPMAGITDHAFRSFMKELGTGVVISELVSADGIKFRSPRTLNLMSFDETQRPVGIQLFGGDPEIMADAAKLVEEMGADFVDVNFGCPVPKVTKKGAGSAVLKDLPAMAKLLSAMVKAVRIPVTIKIRTGWDSSSRNACDVVDLAYNEGITWVAIHGRTRAQGYEGNADWNFIKAVKEHAKLPVLGNGDIVTPDQAIVRMKETGVDGVLIGRGALKNPFIFKDTLAKWKGLPLDQTGPRDYVHLFERLTAQITAHCDDHITQIQLKKFAAWFATGYPGAAQLRRTIFQTKSTEEVMSTALEFFSSVGAVHQAVSSQDGFLMGGHG